MLIFLYSLKGDMSWLTFEHGCEQSRTLDDPLMLYPEIKRAIGSDIHIS